MLVRAGFWILITFVALGDSSDILKNLYISHIHCNANVDYCPKQICKLSFLTRTVKTFTWSCNLIKPVDFVNIHVTLFYRYRNGYQTFLIDLNIDVCSYYKNTLGSAVMDLVRKEIEQYSTNIIHPCPFIGNLSITNLPLTGALVNHIFVPSGDYKLVINCTVGEKQVFGMLLTFFFSVPAGRTLEDDNMG